MATRPKLSNPIPVWQWFWRGPCQPFALFRSGRNTDSPKQIRSISLIHRVITTRSRIAVVTSQAVLQTVYIATLHIIKMLRQSVSRLLCHNSALSSRLHLKTLHVFAEVSEARYLVKILSILSLAMLGIPRARVDGRKAGLLVWLRKDLDRLPFETSYPVVSA